MVNDNISNTIQSADSLNNLNLDNVSIYPYLPGNDDYSITIAITPDEESHVPQYIKKIINIGNRHVAIATFLDIIACLDIHDDLTLRRLTQYSNRTADDSVGIRSQYRHAAVSNTQMNSLLKHINQGILVTSSNGLVLLSNDRMEEFVGRSIQSNEDTMEDLLGRELTIQLMSISKQHTANVQIGQRSLLAELEIERYAGEDHYFFCFSDITYIHYLESCVKQKAVSRGFVAKMTFDDVIGNSEQMRSCIEMLKVFARSEKTILIQGESGTGKEILTQSIHNVSRRKAGPFVAINCAALPESLLESELFGYERGAFTGARQSGKAGLFEQAQSGTIFLDEIGDMPLALQTRLLRVLQEREIMRLGSNHIVPIDVRIIAASNQNLKERVEQGKFRADLYYRLNVLPVYIPPLRQRKEDIIPLFVRFSGEQHVPAEIVDALLGYPWPGNIRELQNAAEYYEMMKHTTKKLPSFITEYSKTARPQPEASLQALILSVLAHERGIGRSRLCTILNQTTTVSEYTLRKELSSLQAQGKIIVHTGRGGIELRAE